MIKTLLVVALLSTAAAVAQTVETNNVMCVRLTMRCLRCTGDMEVVQALPSVPQQFLHQCMDCKTNVFVTTGAYYPFVQCEPPKKPIKLLSTNGEPVKVTNTPAPVVPKP